MSIKPIAMRDAFLTRIREGLDIDPTLFLVTADFGSPVIDRIRADHPQRFVNVGIAEQNLINVTAGLALEGFNVFAYAIAPFITMRCLEQIRVSLCLLSQVRRMSVTLIGVGAGYSYVVSGPTHQCYEDISVMRTLPAIQVLSPSDHLSAAALFDRCREPGIRYIRLDAQVLPPLDSRVAITRGMRRLHGEAGDVAMVATGYMTHTALDVAASLDARGITCTVHDMIDLFSFDRDELADRFSEARLVVSIEESFTGRGGLDAVIQELLRERNLAARFLAIGVPPAYGFRLGSRKELHEDAGISPATCVERVVAALAA